MISLHNKRRYAISIIFIFLLYIQLFVPFFSARANAAEINAETENDNGVISVTDANTYENTEFYKDSLLGIAGGFHLVGLDTVEKKAHINGNILAKNFINGGNFGTRDVKEVSYLKNITSNTIISTSADINSVLVVGKDAEIATVDNKNAWSINGNKVDNPSKIKSPNSLWQDDKADFIDFDEVEAQTNALVKRLAVLGDNGTSITNSDMNKQEITVTDDSNFNVYNLKNDDFNFSNPISIKGFDKDQASTLIINVDMSKMTDSGSFSIPNSVASYTDDSKVSTGEVSEWSNANVIWNFFDSSKEDKVYTGDIQNTGAVTGSILAPGASIDLNNNLNGTVVGKKIVVNAETHRDDYVPTDKESKAKDISVEKKWVGETGDSVTVNLLADGEKVDSIQLNSGNDWTHTFTNLPVVQENESGETISYTIEEVKVDGYKSSIAGSAASGFVITNTEESEDSEEPTDPDGSTTPKEPTDPDGSTNSEGSADSDGSVEPDGSTNSEGSADSEEHQADKLPQTGDSSNFLAPIGISFIIAGFLIFMFKRSIKE